MPLLSGSISNLHAQVNFLQVCHVKSDMRILHLQIFARTAVLIGVFLLSIDVNGFTLRYSARILIRTQHLDLGERNAKEKIARRHDMNYTVQEYAPSN